ncbi:MATE family efflux transporter [Neptunicella sp. SCSIO 80796]|uniref:MATE family efflux transporter n=1 Tax=Neptunicella plasticusilytica TaxID=3117012 RepID=UPI003A4D77C6
MKDLTQGSIPRHLINMAIPIAIGLFVQTLYFLVDLYFVGQLGDTALAGVSAAGNANLIIIALTQILNVGTATLVSHAVGRKDKKDANLIFNQSILLASGLAILTLIVGYGCGQYYMQTLSNDAQIVEAGTTYLYWFLPNMALQFSIVAMAAALRGTGIVKPVMLVQMLSVLINILLAPVLIAGWGTGYPLGVAGAGMASSIAVVIGVIILLWYFFRLEHYVSVNLSLWRPDWASWKRLLSIGFPAGAEFFLMFLYMAVIYWTIQQFGASAQAGFGLGSRVMQALFLPAMALAFSAPAVAGQNFGARLPNRVEQTFKWTALLSCLVMAILTAICLWQAPALISSFSDDIAVLTIASGFLSLICWNFIPTGLIFTCSGMFQGLGNTWPALLSSATRLLSFALPAIWLSGQGDFYIEQIWYLSIATVTMQSLLSLYLLRGQMYRRLQFD